jgi:uncharacterized protein YggT (Ycf19 family)
MGVVDFILNLVGLWFWLNWRSIRYASAALPISTPLLATLKPTESRPRRRWGSLAALGVLLLFRSVLYRQVGAAANWLPHLRLGVLSLPFDSQSPGRMLLFSLLSFGMVLSLFYLWLMVLSLVNRNAPDNDVMHRLVRFQLGWLDRWPPAVKLLLPPAVAGLFWFALAPLFTELSILPPAESIWHLLAQALVMGLATLLAWKFLIAAVLGLHLLISYVYLGQSPLWHYVTMTARRLLVPLTWIPLRIGRIDFAPVLAIAVALLAAEAFEYGLTALWTRLPHWI